jgi:hypothetical protein
MTMMSSYVRYSSRPERVAHAIVTEAKRGNADLAKVVEQHAGRLSRGELLSVLRLMFAHIARMSKRDDRVEKG